MQGKDKSGGGYTGPERRKGPRRTAADRRTEVRWEPGKKIRRNPKGRRSTDQTWDPTRAR